LYDSIAKPLYDRGLLAEYPPDFKILTGLIGLQEGVVDEQQTTLCAIMVLAMPQDDL
jgi:penicillin-binding protein 2